MKKLSIRQNMLWNTIGCLLYQGCLWLTTIFVVTLSSTYENSGIYAFCMSAGNIYNAFATYNMRTFQVSDVKQEYSTSEYVALRMVTVGITFLVFLGYPFFLSTSGLMSLTLVAFFIFKADEAFVNVLYGVDQKASRMDIIGISQALRGILLLVAFSVVLQLTQNLSLACLAMFAPCFAVTLLFDIPMSRRIECIIPRITVHRCLKLLKTCFPIVMAIALCGLVSTISRQWFGFQYGEEALGIYAAIATPCVIVQVLANYLYSPFLVPLAFSWNNKELFLFKKQLFKLAVGFIFISLVCLGAVILFGEPALVILFGNSISEYAWLIVPAIGATIFSALAFFFTDLFSVIRKLNYCVILNFLAVVMCICELPFLLPAMGMNGINVTIITSFALSSIVGIFMLTKSLKEQKRPERVSN